MMVNTLVNVSRSFMRTMVLYADIFVCCCCLMLYVTCSVAESLAHVALLNSAGLQTDDLMLAVSRPKQGQSRVFAKL